MATFFAFAQELEVEGNLKSQNISITDGAASGKILVSDANGNASWGEVPSRTRAILISPGFASSYLNGAVDGIIGGWHPSIDLPNAGFPEVRVSVPIPPDYSGGGFNMKVLYTSTTTTGQFRFEFGFRATAVGGDLGRAPGGAINLAAPVFINALAEGERFQSEEGGLYDANSRIIHLALARDANHVDDTSTGTLRIVGVLLEYSD